MFALWAAGVHGVDELEDVIDIQLVVACDVCELIVAHVRVEESGDVEEVNASVSLEVCWAGLESAEVSACFCEGFWPDHLTHVTAWEVVGWWVDAAPDS